MTPLARSIAVFALLAGSAAAAPVATIAAASSSSAAAPTPGDLSKPAAVPPGARAAAGGTATPSLALNEQMHEATAAAAPAAPQVPLPTIYIREFRVLGAKELPAVEVMDAVYPYLGPGRTVEDVEQARAALEKAYQAKGYQGASVQIPQQRGRGGIVYLQVYTGTIAKLRVKGSRFFLPSAIKSRAQSLAEGKALNFTDVSRDIVALNQFPDRQVTPELRPGMEPGTLEVDLNVKDKFPLHGSVELNNRYNANTTPLRLTVSANYNNLWQLGHTVGFSYQVAPERRLDAEIYSGYYIARFPGVENFSLMLQGRKQNSNIVVDVGSGVNVGFPNSTVQPGESWGVRGIFTLPPLEGFYHSVTVGLDYSHYKSSSFITGPLGRVDLFPPTSFTYYPVSANYSATWAGKSYTTDFNLGVTAGLRGPGSRRTQFEENRFDADTNFIKLRGDLSHTQDLPYGAEGFVKIEGQVSSAPLVNTEQFSGGGLSSVRGYLDGEILADNGVNGTIELRSPSILWFVKKKEGTNKNEDNEWRIYLFGDYGAYSLRSPLPEQDANFALASAGVGTRMRLLGHFTGSLDAALALIDGVQTQAGDGRLTFRVSTDF